MISFVQRSLVVVFIAARPLAAQRIAADTIARDTNVVRPDSGASRINRESSSLEAPVRFDRRLAAGLVLGSLAVISLDRSAESWLQRPGLQRNHALQSTAAGFNWLGGTGLFAGSVASIAVGRLTGNERLTEIGFRTTEAIAASSAVVGLTKGLVGRQRPFLETNDPVDFFVGRGFGNAGLTSFPSGHTAAAFSAATVLSLETRRYWPHASPVVTPLLYAGATTVGLARMYDSKHWASDVALGATIGTLSGFQVMRYNDAHPGNRLARLLTRTSIAPSGGHGVTVGLRIPLR